MKYKKSIISLTTLLNLKLLGYRDMQVHIQNLEKKPTDMAQKFTQSTIKLSFK